MVHQLIICLELKFKLKDNMKSYFYVNNTEGLVCSKMLHPMYEQFILPYFTLSDKVVLGGSLAMKMLGLMEFEETLRQPDLDFSLTEPLTQQELSIIVDFFNLINRDENPYKPEGHIVDEKLLKQDLLLFTKLEEVEIMDSNLQPSGYKQLIQRYKIDFFNHTYLSKRDYLPITYKTHDDQTWGIKLTHPSIILAAKAKYAFDVRVGKQFKHWEDLEELFHRKNADKYFRVLKDIEKYRTNKRKYTSDPDLAF